MIIVLHVVTDMNCGGLETMIMNYYRHMDRTQIQFHFLTHRDYLGDYGEEIENLGGKIYHLPPLNPFSLKYKKALRSFFINNPEYRIIHVHQDCMSSVILKEAKRFNIPVRIAHCHSSFQDKNVKLLLKLYYKQFISKYATKLFACSEEAGIWMFNGAPFDILNNAIEAKQYVFNEEKRKKIRGIMGLADETIVIGHVGRFDEVKNHTFLVDLFFEVQKLCKANLLLVGEGVLRKKIESKVELLELQDKVLFTGKRSDVADLMQAMDVFVFPSLYEGLPVTLVEAQAAGLPCLISENVPIECEKTHNLITQICLSESPVNWAKKVIELSNISRKNTVEEIKESGFDIHENAKKLNYYYINEWKEKCQQ